MTPRSRDIQPEISVADPRAAYGGSSCPCGADGPCHNPNCHVRTGHVPGGTVVTGLATRLRERGLPLLAQQADALAADLASVRAQLDEARTERDSYAAQYDEVVKEAAEALEQLEQMRASLELYGEHRPSCTYQWNYDGQNLRCNCGYHAALAAADPASVVREATSRVHANTTIDHAEDVRGADTLPCGHPPTAVVNAGEGTSYCGECAARPNEHTATNLPATATVFPRPPAEREGER